MWDLRKIRRLWASPDLIWVRDENGDPRLDTEDGRTIGYVRVQIGGYGYNAVWGRRRKPFMTTVEAKGWLEWIAQPYWRRW